MNIPAVNNLFLVRHGIAEPERSHREDSARALTKEGIELLQRSAQGYRVILGSSVTLLSSPFLRAQQTAQSICAALAIPPERFLVLDSLGLRGNQEELIVDLNEARDRHPDTSLVVVGHQPNLMNLVFDLCGVSARPLRDLGRGCVIQVEIAHEIAPRTAKFVKYYSVEEIIAAGEA